jgi:hypothetical protein
LYDKNGGIEQHFAPQGLRTLTPSSSAVAFRRPASDGPMTAG